MYCTLFYVAFTYFIALLSWNLACDAAWYWTQNLLLVCFWFFLLSEKCLEVIEFKDIFLSYILYLAFSNTAMNLTCRLLSFSPIYWDIADFLYGHVSVFNGLTRKQIVLSSCYMLPMLNTMGQHIIFTIELHICYVSLISLNVNYINSIF